MSFEPIDNVYHCSEIASHSLVDKGLGAFMIPCTIESWNLKRTLGDLWSSINLMLLVFYK